MWIIQVILAAVLGMAGFMKRTGSMEELANNGMTFVNHYAVGTVRFIGVSEILAALGFILPSAVRILPKLTPLAAKGLAFVMALATQYHVTKNESPVASVILGILCLVVAWG